tara:strand:- start:2042 stop:2512 length:471 start_codon:yes stop_codon:yes gene_type:complete
MAKLKGAAKTAFLKRMAAGRRKARNGTKKGMLRKTSRKAYTFPRKSAALKRRKPRKTMARRRSRIRSAVRRRTDLRGIFKRGILGEAVKGIGSGAIAGLVVNQVAPQYSTVAATGAGFLGGGFVGALASLFVNGGLSSITSMFGGRTTSVNGAMGV